MSLTKFSENYEKLLKQLKQQVISSQQKAALSVNKELILLYYEIGNAILSSQNQSNWGSKVIDKLSNDLQSSFPELKGFSVRNLKYMRKFADEFLDSVFVQQVVAQIPWGHIIVLMNKMSDIDARIFYINKTIEHGWSRNILNLQIETNLHIRQGKAVNNFKTKLPSPQSDLAVATLKDPYTFDFLNIGEEAQEREVEKALCAHMEKFLLELGAGFAFVGRQYHLEVGDQDFYIDLLFYHLKLRCFVVIELKDKEFKPEYAGKMNFYLSAVDDLVKHSNDQPSIGLILCKTKNNILAEYALRDMSKPIGLAEYRLSDSLPDDLKTGLPSIEELEIELSKDMINTVSNKGIEIKDYQLEDTEHLISIFYKSVHNIGNQYYSQGQLAAWAPKESLDITNWKAKWNKTPPIVATIDGEIVGFAEFESNGYIDCFYCDPDFQGKGVGSRILKRIEDLALTQKNKKIFAEVSINAKLFFENKGFKVIEEQTVKRRGINLINFVMEKKIKKNL
ncbi:PDDEXK nuclease domain-containing protein [Francisella noatunensis]|uniref:PDDEXK nuclease domain-containing protein n=1 Tax=Francisella noatunensis TaxID=657445 RepID=UPI001904034E|nr:PDDEXK nuclease domain-containing protein [Francisella noatunensis]MBK2061080.1 DUF1016 family protein [Francisella noatunensis]